MDVLSFPPGLPVAEGRELGRALRSTRRRSDQAELRSLNRDPVQSPQPAILDAIMGQSDAFDHAITTSSTRDADQVERDFALLEQAVVSGRLPAERGV